MRISKIIQCLAYLAAAVLAFVVLFGPKSGKLVACELEAITLWICIIAKNFEK